MPCNTPILRSRRPRSISHIAAYASLHVQGMVFSDPINFVQSSLVPSDLLAPGICIHWTSHETRTVTLDLVSPLLVLHSVAKASRILGHLHTWFKPIRGWLGPMDTAWENGWLRGSRLLGGRAFFLSPSALLLNITAFLVSRGTDLHQERYVTALRGRSKCT